MIRNRHWRWLPLLVFLVFLEIPLLADPTTSMNFPSQESISDFSSILRGLSSSQKEAGSPNLYLYDLAEVPQKEIEVFRKEENADRTSLDPFLIAQNEEPLNITDNASKTILINFNNVSIIEYIRFVSRISNRNFIFDESDLQFNVTIISEEPATIENIMTALLQELRIHDLTLIEEGNNLIIHKNTSVSGISSVLSNELELARTHSDIVTQVFRLNTLDPEKAATILRPLTSAKALIEILPNSNNLIVTDLTSNVSKISQLLKSLDAPNSGMVIGQYVSRVNPIGTLIPLVQQIMHPISQDQPLTFVTHPVTNSLFIVSTPFLVERTIAVLQYLDEDQGATRILNLNELRLGGVPGATTPAGRPSTAPTLGQGAQGQAGAVPGTVPLRGAQEITPQLITPETQPSALTRGAAPVEGIFRTPSGQWQPSPQGTWIFKPEVSPAEAASQQVKQQRGEPTAPPQGSWSRDYEGNWNFTAGDIGTGGPSPLGHWLLDKDGNWIYELESGETFNPTPLNRQFLGKPILPGGIEKRAKFTIYKLQYRKGENVELALRQIADTLQQNERGNEDLISTLRSVQWLIATNSLIFSGTQDSLDKAVRLTDELDKPARQVFLEMLILETTLEDSLNFGVTYGTRFGGGDTSGSQGFISGSTPLVGALATTGFSNLGQPIGNQQVLVPDGTNLARTPGFNLGVIGQKITHCGTEFGSIGALIDALHDRTKDEVISNPKILIEDNSPAQLFVGINTPYRTQSISNDRGSVLTSNFEYRDVGTKLKVTPYIGNGEIITLAIEEEVSTIIAGLITNASSASTSPGPTTRINRTTTRVHIPDNYFLIISGMMQDEESRGRNQVPCLGGVPLLGAAFTSKKNHTIKRNLLIFMRPKIVDTEEEIDFLTKHQQDIYDYKNCLRSSDEYETVEALDFLNVRKTLHPEDGKDEFDYDNCNCR